MGHANSRLDLIASRNRVVDKSLSPTNIAGETNEVCQRTRLLLCVISWLVMGQISMLPFTTFRIIFAQAVASSRVWRSNTHSLMSCSLVSANCPTTISVSLFVLALLRSGTQHQFVCSDKLESVVATTR